MNANNKSNEPLRCLKNHVSDQNFLSPLFLPSLPKSYVQCLRALGLTISDSISFHNSLYWTERPSV